MPGPTSRRALVIGFALGALALAGCSRSAAPAPLPEPTAAAPSTPLAEESPGRSASAGLPELSTIVETVAPGVVAVDTSAIAVDFFLRPVEQRGAGSGIIFRPDGYIVTNAHVIKGASNISVALADGRVFPATVVGRDDPSDLAVLRIEARGLPALELADPAQARVGDWVIAFGNALALDGGPTVTVGIISAIGRAIRTESGFTLSDLIQTDAAINQGNSGGPLVNLDGKVVGLNTTIIAGAQGIGFSINSGTVERFVNDLIEQGRVQRPVLGVSGRTVTEGIAARLRLSVKGGVVVTAVSPGPGERAGLLAGDVIVEIGGQTVTGWSQFLSELWSHRPGETIDLAVVRGSERLVLSVDLTAPDS